MHVLVTGGTGFVGRHLCARLLEDGHEVTALARHPDEAALPDGINRRSGDVTEYEGLTDALEDADVVVHLVALSPLYRPRHGEGMHDKVHVQGTRNVVRAMEAVDIDRLVYMSGISADPKGPTAFIRAKGRAEGIVTSSDLRSTIVRPTAIFGDGGDFIPFVKQVTTPYLTGLPGGGRIEFQPIWVVDVADILAEIVADDKHAGEVYEIGGPEQMTLADVTRAIYEKDGRFVRILPVPMPLAGLGLTIAGPLPFIPFGRDQYRALKLDNTLEENHISAFDLAPEDLRTLESYLQAARE